ncbi:MAG: hypothetical protein AB9842_14805 [Bacteroidales bacterium]
MEKKIATVLSWIFHPLFLPTYTYLLLLHGNSYLSLSLPLSLKWNVTGFVFLLTAILPAIVNYIFLRSGIIKSLMMESRQERLLPYLVSAACFYLTAYMANTLQMPAVFYLFSLGITMLALMAVFLTFYLKVSIHMIGIGGVTGTFLALSLRWHLDLLLIILLLFLISGLMGYARLRLKTHSQAEIYSGYITGFGVMLLLFLLI